MIEKNTLARPYAKAIFNIAKSTASFKEWAETLELLAKISADAKMNEVLRDPTLSAETLVEFFEAVVNETSFKLNSEARNLLQLLALKRRLIVLPEIKTIYEKFWHEEDNRLPVELVSVIPLTEAEKSEFSHALAERFGKKIILHNRIDPDLIGGFWLQASDTVIDASLKGRLEQLKETMGE